MTELQVTSTEPPVFPFDIPLSVDYIEEYADYREKCPIPHVRLATGGQAQLLLRYQDIRKALTDTAVFSRAACLAPEVPVLLTGAKLPGVMANMDGSDHTRLRRLIAGPLSTRAVARFRPQMERFANELVDSMVAEGPRADLLTAFAIPFATQVLFEIFGCPTGDIPALMDWFIQILSYTRYSSRQQESAYRSITEYCARLVADKRAHPGPDLVSALIQVREDDGDRLSEDELVMLIWSHLGAGAESMVDLITNALLTFHRNQDQWELLRHRPELLPRAVNEVLRYVGVGLSGFERMATQDTELGGTAVTAGTVVIPVWRSANFDSTAFQDPQRFDVTRSDSPHLGFGHGPHRCSGAPLAIAELEVALGTLLRRLPRLRLAVAESELEWDSGVAMRRMVAMPVTW